MDKCQDSQTAHQLPNRILALTKQLHNVQQKLFTISTKLQNTQSQKDQKDRIIKGLQLHNKQLLQDHENYLQQQKYTRVQNQQQCQSLSQRLNNVIKANAILKKENYGLQRKLQDIQNKAYKNQAIRKQVEKDLSQSHQLHRRQIKKLKNKLKDIQLENNKQNISTTYASLSILDQSSIQVRSRPISTNSKGRTPGRLYSKNDTSLRC